MSDHGYVYVLINPSMENLVKIGKTTRTPDERAKELSSTTGVPTPFIVVYKCYFKSCSDAEVFVHVYLENKGYRVSKDREFFEISITDAIDAIIVANEHFGTFDPTTQSEENHNTEFSSTEHKVNKPHEEEFKIAEAFYYGYGDEIKDYDDAMKHYLKAIKLGSTKAYLKVGIMYKAGKGVKKNEKKSLQYFKDGANVNG